MAVQTDLLGLGVLSSATADDNKAEVCRSLHVLKSLMAEQGDDALKQMNEQELAALIDSRLLKQQELEKKLGDEMKAVAARRVWLRQLLKWTTDELRALPFHHFDYSFVSGACCENVIGYVPVPVGIAGPLRLNGRKIYVPMATTEGALVASTNRGCRAIADSVNGASARVFRDGMSRAPLVQFASALEAIKLMEWLQVANNYQIIKQKFDSSSGYVRLQEVKCQPSGRKLLLRFVATTGDAMGMNMVSKATEEAMKLLQQMFVNMEVISLSGNYCVDKKAAAINWIEGRGKSVVTEVVIPRITVAEVLKTSVEKLVDLAQKKLNVGSAMAATIGGNNAQAANIVAAVFIATGQDVAQVVSSSMCMTEMEKTDEGDLYVSCTMPCLEVGTTGGGTILPAQRECLEMLDCAGGHSSQPGKNAVRLAETICATVLAGELSLLAAQCSGDLVKSHLKMNRSRLNLASPASEPGLDGRTTTAIMGRSRRHQGVFLQDVMKAPGCSSVL